MEHVRIDEGVKRGKRKPKPPRNERDPDTQQFLPVLPADFDDVKLFRRLASGERIAKIAREYNVTPEAFYMRYKGNQNYLDAREIGTDLRLDKSEDEIEAADDPLSLTRAREMFNAAFRRAQVEFPARWGQKQELTIKDNSDLGERLRRSRERTIDGEVVKPAAPAQTSNIIDLQPDATQQSENTPK